MENAGTAGLKPEALSHVLESLRDVGVAGNEGDRPFDAHGLEESRGELEQLLRERGYKAGSLEIHTLPQPRDGVDVLVYDTDRHSEVSQAEHAWEQDYRRRWRVRVERRLEDWLQRLSDLRAKIEAWTAEMPESSSLALVDLPSAEMFEELMRRFGIPPARMPVFELRAASKRVLRFQPKGLWIIGANGRVDLITKSASPILVDRSEPLAGFSDWRLYYAKDGQQSKPFTAETFKELLHLGMQ